MSDLMNKGLRLDTTTSLDPLGLVEMSDLMNKGLRLFIEVLLITNLS